ncbi:MAG: hypothetical protein OEV44_14220, partial [Spirochaetota bacterium]|nr:hypothetical protein [Spirochaetota bacterium]
TSEAHYIYNKKVIPTHNVATKPYKNSDEWISSLEDIYCEFILKKCSKYVISFFKGAMRERNGKSINNYEENDFSDKDYKLLRSFLCSELDSLERKHPKYFDRTRKFKTYLKCSK